MKYSLGLGLAVAVVALIALPQGALAGGKHVLMDGETAAERIKEVTTKIPWQRDFEEALAAAKQQDKPLFWLQMVGDLDDGL